MASDVPIWGVVDCSLRVLKKATFTHAHSPLSIRFQLLPLLITVLPAKLYAPVRSWVVPSTFLCYIWLVPAIFSKWSVRQASRPPTAASLAYLFLVGSNARFLGTTALARPTLLRQRLPILLLSLPFQLVSNQVTCLHRSWNPAVEAFTARLATAIARGSVPFFPPSAELALRRVACVFSMNWLMIVLGIAVPQFILLKTECSMRGAFLMRAGRAPARLSRIVLSGWGAALALPIVLGSAFIVSLFTAQMPLLFGLDVGGPDPAL